MRPFEHENQKKDLLTCLQLASKDWVWLRRPKNPPSLDNYLARVTAKFLYRSGDFSGFLNQWKLLESYAESHHLEPLNSSDFFLKSMVLYRLEKYEEAKVAFTEGERLLPEQMPGKDPLKGLRFFEASLPLPWIFQKEAKAMFDP